MVLAPMLAVGFALGLAPVVALALAPAAGLLLEPVSLPLPVQMIPWVQSSV